MTDYTKTTDFAAKDSLPSGDSGKIIKGTEFETEFDNIATAVATKSNIASPTFTGTTTIPTVDINGGAIDAVTLGTNSAVTEAQVDNININGNTISSSDTDGNIDLTPNGTGEVNISKVDIDSGAIDGTTVGAASASTGAFTTLTASTSLNIASSTTVDGVLDEDNMASDSATKLATQQSIKAYVDSQVGSFDTLAEVLAQGNTTGGTNLVVDSGDTLDVNGPLDANGTIKLDGNYPVGTSNVALGNSALDSLTTGSNNVAMGDGSLQNNTSASNNTALGYEAGNSNTTGLGITAVGRRALKANDTGSYNTAVGYNAFTALTTGSSNVALGSTAGEQLTTGNYNVAIGRYALLSATTDGSNIAMGHSALQSLTGSGGQNVAVGFQSQTDSVTGNSNVSLGNNALQKNTTGDRNVAIGHQALQDLNITNGADSYNTAVGSQAGADLTTGLRNTIVGALALDGITTQLNHTALGYQAGTSKSSGDDCIYIGIAAGRTDNGNDNIAIGEETLRSNSNGSSRNIAIGTNALYNHDLAGDNYHVAIGFHAGRSITTGTYNTFIGPRAGESITTGGKNTIIGRYNGDQGGLDITTSSNNIVLSDGDGNPRVFVDSSGNTLIGQTSTTQPGVGNTTLGTAINAGGLAAFSRNPGSANATLYVNRNTDDGPIVGWNKDGSLVGTIGTNSSRLTIGNGDTGLLFAGDLNNITPFNTTGNASRDDAIDLGESATRFKDLYLSGGVYVGGTGSANLLDDYEEGTWTGKVADAESGGNESSTNVFGTYVKIGKIVYLQFNVTNINTTGLTSGNDVFITGIPFTSASVTGNAKYTGTAYMSEVTFEQTPLINLGENKTVLRIAEVRNNAGVDFVTVSEISSGSSDIHGTIVYQAT